MNNGTQASATTEEFEAAWNIANSRYLREFVMVSALFALTGAGEQPVDIERVAANTGETAPDARELIESLGRLAHVDHETVYLTPGTSSPSPRFLVRIDDRLINSGGCAPDLFWIAVCSGKTVDVETHCRATGTPIRTHLRSDGTANATPTETVVAVVHPGKQPELLDTIDATRTDTSAPDEDFCYHQPFFASPSAATEWLDTHPGGRVFTVAEFYDFWRRITQNTLAKANVHIL